MVDHNNKKLTLSYIHQLPTLDFNTDPNVLQVLYNTSKSALEKNWSTTELTEFTQFDIYQYSNSIINIDGMLLHVP